jgi:lipopolysaccharide export system permease protein
MKLIDRYIIRQFISHFLFALLAIILVFIIIDLMENLDDFIDRDVPAPIILRYYIFFIPEMIKSMIPVAMLLSSLFTTGKLSSQNELVAIKSSGVSLYRFMLPFLGVGIVVTLLSVYFNGWIVPVSNKQKFQIERVHLSKHLQNIPRYNIFLQDTPVRFLSLGYFDDSRNTVSRVSIQEFSDTNFSIMARRYDSESMYWDYERRLWTMDGAVVRDFSVRSEQIEHFDSLALPQLRFNPDDLLKNQLKPDEMDYWELKDFIEVQRRAGQETSRWLVDFYSKISFPFASIVVIFFGVPFSSQKRRGGMALQFAVGVMITFLYMAFMKISEVMGYSGQYHPLLMAWLPNLIFLAAGLVNMLRVRQ